MTFQPAHKDTENPPGQVVYPIPPTMGERTLGDVIDKVRRSDPIQPKRIITNEILLEVMQLTDTCNIYAEQGKFDGYTEAKSKLRTYLENM